MAEAAKNTSSTYYGQPTAEDLAHLEDLEKTVKVAADPINDMINEADNIELLPPPPAAAVVADDDIDMGDVVDDDAPGGAASHVDRMTKSERNPARYEASVYNASIALRYDERTEGMLGYDEFTDMIMVRKPFESGVHGNDGWRLNNPSGDLLSEHHTLTLMSWMQSPYMKGRQGVSGGYNCLINKGDMRDAITNVAFQTRFDSLTASLDGLQWDGVERVDTLLHRVMGVDNDAYHAAIFRIWCVAAVARAYEPGAKFDNILSVVGKQGTRKSTFAEVMGGLTEKSHFRAVTKKSFDDPKKLIEQTVGSWVVELPENSALKGISDDDRKAMITATVDRDRMSYRRFAEDYKRRWVMIITSNDRKFLSDPTGNRRYWVVTLPKDMIIDIDTLRAERDQIWAEAVHIYRQMRISQPEGDLPLCLSPELEKVAGVKQEAARLGDEIEDMVSSIRAFFETPKHDGDLMVDGHRYYLEYDKAEIWNAITNGNGGEFLNSTAARNVNKALSLIDYVSIKNASWIKRIGKKANKVVIDFEPFRAALDLSKSDEVEVDGVEDLEDGL